MKLLFLCLLILGFTGCHCGGPLLRSSLLQSKFCIPSSIKTKAEREYYLGPQMRSDLEATLMSNGVISDQKADRFSREVEIRQTEIRNYFFKYYHKKKGLSKKKANKKAVSEKEYKLYQVLINGIQRVKETKDIELAKSLMQLNYSLKIAGRKLFSLNLPTHLTQIFKSWELKKDSPIEQESINLFNPITGNYFVSSDLATLKSNGVDLSTLNPTPESTYWQNPNKLPAKSLSVIYTTGQFPLHVDSKIWFPTNQGTYKRVRKTQTKPKIDITAVGPDGKKHKFKFKTGSEYHAEITASALLVGIGYSADVAKYVRNFRINLGDVTPEKVKMEWKSYFLGGELGYKPNDFIVEEGKDENGYYIVFNEGLLEAKPKGNDRVGSWAWGQHDHGSLREVRALTLFNMWINNTDVKAGNNKLIYKENGEIFHIQHDNGFSFGKFSRETIDSFSWDFVKEKNNSLKFRYRIILMNSRTDGTDDASYSDYKWMARLIANLSVQQIKDAVAIGGWPKAIQTLLVEKLIYRRNQLVVGFKLEGEKSHSNDQIKLYPADRHLTTPDGAIADGKLTAVKFDGYNLNFGSDYDALAMPVLSVVKDIVKKLAIRGISTAAEPDYEPISFSVFGVEGVVSVSGELNRDIERNPDPKGLADQFIVRDTFAIQYGLAPGSAITGKVSFIKKYTIVYPAKNYDSALNANGFIVNVLLPFHVWKNQLPDNYVLISEDGLETEGAAKLEGTRTISLGVKGAVTRISLNRVILDHQEADKLRFFVDKSLETELSARLYALLSVVKIPLADMSIGRGHLTRKEYVLAAGAGSHQETGLVISRTIHKGDLETLSKHSAVTVLDSDFYKRSFEFGLLGFMKSSSVYRRDEIGIADSAGNEQRKTQVEVIKGSDWRFLDNGESREKKLYFASHRNDDDNIVDPSIHVRFLIKDFNTTTKEFQKYIDFVNASVDDSKFIDFTPARHSLNGIWGHIHTHLSIDYSELGIEAVLSLSVDEVKEALAATQGLSVSKFHKNMLKYRGNNNSNLRESWYYSHVATLIMNLKAAKKENNKNKKLRKIVKLFNSMSWKVTHSYEGSALGAIHSLIGKENYHLSILIDTPSRNENPMPDRKYLFNQIGDPIPFAIEALDLDALSPSEAFEIFR